MSLIILSKNPALPGLPSVTVGRALHPTPVDHFDHAERADECIKRILSVAAGAEAVLDRNEFLGEDDASLASPIKQVGHSGATVLLAPLDDYFAAQESRGSKGVRADRYAAEARIVPDLGNIGIDKLTAKRIREWHVQVAAAPKLLRTGKTADKRATRAVIKDPDAVRARRSTANRILTILKAALNHAFHEGKVASDEPWRKVKPFREADAAVIQYLSANACGGHFRRFSEPCQSRAGSLPGVCRQRPR